MRLIFQKKKESVFSFVRKNKKAREAFICLACGLF